MSRFPFRGVVPVVLAAAFLAQVKACRSAQEPDVCAEPSSSTRSTFTTEQSPFRILVFTRHSGYEHASIPAAVAAIQSLGVRHGFAVVPTEDVGFFVEEVLRSYAAVMFLNTTGAILPDSQKAAFKRYIHQGEELVGIHSAMDTESGWAWYHQLSGRRFSLPSSRSAGETNRVFTGGPPRLTVTAPLGAHGRVVRLSRITRKRDSARERRRAIKAAKWATRIPSRGIASSRAVAPGTRPWAIPRAVTPKGRSWTTFSAEFCTPPGLAEFAAILIVHGCGKPGHHQLTGKNHGLARRIAEMPVRGKTLRPG